MDQEVNKIDVVELEPSCGLCAHTFRRKCSHDVVVCVPHLKNMPADYCDVCELHTPKEKDDSAS